MAAPGVDPQRAANILADADILGDHKAAEKWGVCLKTVTNYRARSREDEELASRYAEKRKEIDREWAVARRAFLLKGVAKLAALVDEAGVEQMRDVAGAVKIVGDLDVVTRAIDNGEQSDTAGTGQETARTKGLETAIQRLSH